MTLTKIGLLLICLAGILLTEAAASNLLIVILFVVAAILIVLDGYAPMFTRRVP